MYPVWHGIPSRLKVWGRGQGEVKRLPSEVDYPQKGVTAWQCQIGPGNAVLEFLLHDGAERAGQWRHSAGASGWSLPTTAFVACTLLGDALNGNMVHNTMRK